MANSILICWWPVGLYCAELHTTVNIVVRELATLYSIHTGELSQKGKLISQNTTQLYERISGTRNIIDSWQSIRSQNVGFCHD
jgi:hypothetical protein